MQQERKGDQMVAQPTAIIAELDAMLVSILSRQKTGSTGKAERRGHERIAKGRPFLRDAVDVRRLDEGMPRATERVPPQIIEKHENDVRPRIGLFGGRSYRADG